MTANCNSNSITIHDNCLTICHRLKPLFCCYLEFVIAQFYTSQPSLIHSLQYKTQTTIFTEFGFYWNRYKLLLRISILAKQYAYIKLCIHRAPTFQFWVCASFSNHVAEPCIHPNLGVTAQPNENVVPQFNINFLFFSIMNRKTILKINQREMKGKKLPLPERMRNN